jgi:uncharacterized membrane protein
MGRSIERDRKNSRQLSLHPPNSEELAPASHTAGTSLDLFLARNAEKLGLRVYDFVRGHWLGIINFHLLLFVLGSVCAPYLSFLGEEAVAKYIYGFYRISCHQIPSRSFFVFDHQLAVCARCFSFYLSMLAFGILLSLIDVRPLDRKIGFLLILPILIDILLQTVGITESTNLLRVTTAALLSFSLSFYIYPRVKTSLQRSTKDGKEIF